MPPEVTQDPEGPARLDAGLVQRIAALSGLQLTPHRASELVPSLRPLFEVDARIRALGLERLCPLVGPLTPPLSPVWPGVEERSGD